MPTTVVNTIGTGGDYTLPQAWEDDCPANLVTADEIWRGEVLNQEFSGAGNRLTISGQTTDETRYVDLTAQAGASFADHADKLTNPLRYNSAVGAAITQSSSYATAVIITTPYTRISRLQIGATGGNQTAGLSTTDTIIDQCIVQGNDRPVRMGATGGRVFSKIANSLVIINSTRNSPGIFSDTYESSILNCTIIRPSNHAPSNNVSNAAIRASYASPVIKNVAGFGSWHFATVVAGTFTGNNNASDETISFGTSNQASLTYADQFENASSASGTHDFRVKTGATLIDNGSDLSASGITTDIVGTARGATYDIGAWEVAAAALPELTAESVVTLSIVGSASGTVALSGGAAATLAVTAAAAGTVAIAGASAVALVGTSSAAGTVALAAASAAAPAISGAIGGTVAVVGSAAATLAIAGSAAGAVAIAASAAATLGISAAAAGTVSLAASTAVVLSVAGSAAGTVSLAAVSAALLATTSLTTGMLALVATSEATLAIVGVMTGTTTLPAAVASVALAWTGPARRVTWDGEARSIPWTGPARRVTWRQE